MGARLSQKAAIAKFKQVHGNKYNYSKVRYQYSNVKVCIICREHGEFWQTPNAHLRGCGCPKCRSDSMLTTNSDFVKKCKAVHGNKYNYEKVAYRGYKEKVCIICREHGEFWQTPSAHLSGQGCPICARKTVGNINSFSHNEFVKQATKIHGAVYEYKNEYQSAHQKIKITCPKHGDFWQHPYSHLAGHKCPKCNNKVSSLETNVTSWLKKQGIKVQPQKRISASSKQTIDIFLPEHNLGIEINGLYWHSEAHRDKNYHVEKSSLAKSRGFRLLHFWEHQIKNKAPIVKSMLRVRLGLAKLRIFARECTVCQLNSNLANEFLNSNHIQGAAAATIAYGLFLDSELVAVMTFGKPRFSKEAEWEIIRLASSKNTVVIGGASKLFGAFVRECKPASIVSYADLDYADGNVYKQLGFVQKGTSKPRYFWIRGAQLLPRYKTQKHKLPKLLQNFDPNLSESENMRNAGFLKVYNSGNAVFFWKNQTGVFSWPA